jgi:riboflavin kinase/FMN adenylyltransferase
VGYRPTFNGDSLSVETFLLDTPPSIAPSRIEVSFLTFVRDERKFETPALLKAQILRDVNAVNGFHRRFERLRMG